MNYNKKIGVYDGCFNEAVYKNIPANKKCLDIGCWTGNLGEKLIAQKQCLVDGLDVNSDALKIAKQKGYRRIYQMNLNDSSFNFDSLDTDYDCIICADVLEHIINPLLLLKKLREPLAQDGVLIVSLPNIAFIQQRFFLLFGKFDYKTAGILDATHLKFFTQKSIKQLCLQAGYKIISFSGYNQVRLRYAWLKLLGGIYPSLFALQFLIKLKK